MHCNSFYVAHLQTNGNDLMYSTCSVVHSNWQPHHQSSFNVFSHLISVQNSHRVATLRWHYSQGSYQKFSIFMSEVTQDSNIINYYKTSIHYKLSIRLWLSRAHLQVTAHWWTYSVKVWCVRHGVSSNSILTNFLSGAFLLWTDGTAGSWHPFSLI